MLKFDVRPVPFFTIAVANFFLGWLWYSPVLFAKPWMKALKKTPKTLMTKESQKRLPLLFTGAIISSFAFSYVLQILTLNLNAQTFVEGAVVGVLAWLGFALTSSLGTLWEGRSSAVVQINNGLFIFSYALFGGILAIWH